MIKLVHFLIGLGMLIFFQSCTERLICPAYQSAFIHDKDVLERRFSYFREDSTPRILEASKDRFLIVEPMAYRKKLRSLQTIPMRDVYPKEEEEGFDDEFYLAERDGYDSTAVLMVDTVSMADSVYVISLKKEKFNIDQELYLWYLRDHLVYPDVRLLKGKNAEEKDNRKKEKKGFFRNLFKKKEKSDSTIFDVETNATELKKEEDKKGLFHFLKKKKKTDSEKEEEEPLFQNNNEELSTPEEGLDDF